MHMYATYLLLFVLLASQVSGPRVAGADPAPTHAAVSIGSKNAFAQCSTLDEPRPGATETDVVRLRQLEQHRAAGSETLGADPSDNTGMASPGKRSTQDQGRPLV